MGYRTNYNLTIFNKDHKEVDDSLIIIEKIEKDFQITLSHPCGCKWDNHQEDMILFSKKYPNYYFYFSNKGDEQDDIWVSFFYNGKFSDKNLEPQYPTLNEMLTKLI